jgi:hypothetical protein
MISLKLQPICPVKFALKRRVWEDLRADLFMMAKG